MDMEGENGNDLVLKIIALKFSTKIHFRVDKCTFYKTKLRIFILESLALIYFNEKQVLYDLVFFFFLFLFLFQVLFCA